MIRIETTEGPIFAEAEIRQIPINPVRPPTMEHIDPIRRWQDDTERVWVSRPWIVETGGGCQVFCIKPTQTCPRSWGMFESLQAAAWYVLGAPEPSASEGWSDSDLDF